jgi:hypothetical protein
MRKIFPRRIRGPVTVVETAGFGYERRWRVRSMFDAIDGFAERMGYHRHLVISPQGGLVPSDRSNIPYHFWQSGLYRSFQVYDADGLAVPAHMVIEDIASFRRERDAERAEQRLMRRGWTRSPWALFRNGPLPRSGRRRRRPPDYRRVGTFAEVKAAAGFEADMATKDLGLRIRGKRSRSSIGDNDWEGVWSFRGSDRNWKRHRSTQWRD